MVSTALICLGCWIGLSTATAAPADRVAHTPPASVTADSPLVLSAQVVDIQITGVLVLFWRTTGEQQWNEVVFDRVGDHWEATVPATAMRYPGLEYAILTRDGDGRSKPRFASPEAPFQVRVIGDTPRSREQRRLEAYRGQRNKARVYGASVNFGQEDGGSPDAFWDLGASMEYRALRTLHALRFSADRRRGQTPVMAEGEVPGTLTATAESLDAGYTRGAAAAEVAVVETVGLIAGAELGVDQEGFTAGFTAGVRIGRPAGTQMVVDYNAVQFVGRAARIALTWDTIERLPMTAGIGVTTFPADEAWATQLTYDLAPRIGEHLSIELGTSYQARTALAGGFGARAGVGWSY